jgi:SAM-dependent methyltransferase
MSLKSAKQALKSTYRKIFHESTHYLKRELANCNSVLDLGCGKNTVLQCFDNIKYSVGVDKFEPYFEEGKKVYNKYIIADVTEVGFPDKSFDAVMAMDILEHLTKEEGTKLIKNMEKWAKKKIIIFTPNGYVEQEGYGGNEYQLHKCGWSVKELEALGFKTHGIGGAKIIRNRGGAIKYKPKFFWCRISDLTQKIVFRFPKMAFQIFAVKESANNN